MEGGDGTRSYEHEHLARALKEVVGLVEVVMVVVGEFEVLRTIKHFANVRSACLVASWMDLRTHSRRLTFSVQVLTCWRYIYLGSVRTFYTTQSLLRTMRFGVR